MSLETHPHNRSYYHRAAIYCALGSVYIGFLVGITAAAGMPVEMVSPVSAALNPVSPVTRPLATVQDHLQEAAYIYDINPELMYCLVRNESGFRATAKNSTSSAYGYGQFITSTWKQWRKAMGEDMNLELRSDPQEAFHTMAWSLDKGYRNHWAVNKTYCKYVPLRPTKLSGHIAGS
mgnify:CR=1 FL=1